MYIKHTSVMDSSLDIDMSIYNFESEHYQKYTTGFETSNSQIPLSLQSIFAEHVPALTPVSTKFIGETPLQERYVSLFSSENSSLLSLNGDSLISLPGENDILSNAFGNINGISSVVSSVTDQFPISIPPAILSDPLSDESLDAMQTFASDSLHSTVKTAVTAQVSAPILVAAAPVTQVTAPLFGDIATTTAAKPASTILAPVIAPVVDPITHTVVAPIATHVVAPVATAAAHVITPIIGTAVTTGTAVVAAFPPSVIAVAAVIGTIALVASQIDDSPVEDIAFQTTQDAAEGNQMHLVCF